MKLLIISNMAHYQYQKQIFGWGPTVQEINHLAQLFSEIRHIGCLHPGAPPPSALPYSSDRISFLPVPPTGGVRYWDKLNILFHSPLYLQTIWRELSSADLVHVRCPANISLMALLLLALVRQPRPRWVKYAGNWQPTDPESWSYTFQRWWLHHNLSRSWVTINGSWPNQKPHEITFPNPSVTIEEIKIGAGAAGQKQFVPPYQCVFVGRLEKAKGPHILIEAIRQLRSQGVNIEADLIGDGPEANEIKALAEDLFQNGSVRFHGWLPRHEIPAFLKPAHFIILPTYSEGWPKVLSEGMAYGAVPIATALSAIPHYLTTQENAWLLPRPTSAELIKGIEWFLADPNRWRVCQSNALQVAGQFTYDYYLGQVLKVIRSSQTNRSNQKADRIDWFEIK